MPLPPIEFFESALGRTIEDLLFDLISDGGKHPQISKRTLKNWRKGRSTVRDSTAARFINQVEKIAGQVFPSERMPEEDFWTTAPKQQSTYSLRWNSFLEGAEKGLGKDVFWIAEARYLLEISRPFTKECDHIAEAIEKADLAETNIRRHTLAFLRSAALEHEEPDGIETIPLFLETALYLIACYDQDKGFSLLSGLCGHDYDSSGVFPMAQVLDKFREKLNIDTDRALCESLLPGQDPESARVEIRKWRKGKRLPSWERVKQWSRDIEGPESDDIIWTIAFARIIHRVKVEAYAIKPKIRWFEPKMLFQSIDLLNEHASSRFHSWSQSSGRSSSPRDCQ